MKNTNVSGMGKQFAISILMCLNIGSCLNTLNTLQEYYMHLLLGILLLLLCPCIGSAKENFGPEQGSQIAQELYRENATVTLQAQELRCGLGLQYALKEKSTAGIQEFTRSLVEVASLAYGIDRTVEISVMIPYTTRESMVENAGQMVARKQENGVNTIIFGLNTVIPSIGMTGVLSGSLPCKAGYDSHISVGMNMDKVMRPAFIYSGLSWETDKKSSGFGYRAGLGLSLTYALAFGLEMQGALIERNERLRDSLSFAPQVSYYISPNLGIQTRIHIGLIGDVPDAIIDMAASRRF